MPRRYIRKPGVNRGNWAETDLKKAIDKIKRNEIGINKAGKEFGIPSRTLRRRMAKNDYRKLTFGRHPVLGFDSEEQLAQALHQIQTRGYNLYRRMVRRIAYLHAEKLGIRHKFSHKKGLAGYNWIKSFVERYPTLDLLDGKPHQQHMSNEVIDKLYDDCINNENEFALPGTSQSHAQHKEEQSSTPLAKTPAERKRAQRARERASKLTQAVSQPKPPTYRIKKKYPTDKKEQNKLESAAPIQQILIVKEVDVKLEQEEVKIKVEDSEETIEYILPTNEPETAPSPLILTPITFISQPEDTQMQSVCKEGMTFVENQIKVRVYPTDSEVNNALSRINCNAEIADSVQAYINSVVGLKATEYTGAGFPFSESKTAWPTGFYSSKKRIQFMNKEKRESDDFDLFAEFIAPRLREIKPAEKQIEMMQNIIALFPQ